MSVLEKGEDLMEGKLLGKKRPQNNYKQKGGIMGVTCQNVYLSLNLGAASLVV